MDRFRIFDGMANQFDERQDLSRESYEYEVGFAVKFIEFAGRLSSPYPVLAN